MTPGFKRGITGSSLEEQRRKVEEAFAVGLKPSPAASDQFLSLTPFSDWRALQIRCSGNGDFFDDTASVMGWLIYQITSCAAAWLCYWDAAPTFLSPSGRGYCRRQQ